MGNHGGQRTEEPGDQKNRRRDGEEQTEPERELAPGIFIRLLRRIHSLSEARPRVCHNLNCLGNSLDGWNRTDTSSPAHTTQPTKRRRGIYRRPRPAKPCALFTLIGTASFTGIGCGRSRTILPSESVTPVDWAVMLVPFVTGFAAFFLWMRTNPARVL